MPWVDLDVRVEFVFLVFDANFVLPNYSIRCCRGRCFWLWICSSQLLRVILRACGCADGSPVTIDVAVVVVVVVVDVAPKGAGNGCSTLGCPLATTGMF